MKRDSFDFTVGEERRRRQSREGFFYDPAHGFPFQCSLMSPGDALRVGPGEKHVLVYRAFGFALLSIFRLITYRAAACCWTSFL